MAEVVAVRALVVIIKVIPLTFSTPPHWCQVADINLGQVQKWEFVLEKPPELRVGLGIELLTPKQRH